MEGFLGHVPAGSGMAFVVVQHLDPQHESKLSNLLSRVTRMPVQEAAQGMAVINFVAPPPDHFWVGNAFLEKKKVLTRQGFEKRAQRFVVGRNHRSESDLHAVL